MAGPRIWLAAGVMGVAVAGCCKTVPVVPHAMRCNVAPDLTAKRCASPQPIAEDSSFAALVDTFHRDRQSLKECGMAFDALRASLEKCNQEADTYNKKLDEVNDKNDN